MSVVENDTLGSLEAALRDAVAEKVQADKKASYASLAANEALNRVNTLQKQINAKIAAMQAEPEMRGTDWARKPSYPVKE